MNKKGHITVTDPASLFMLVAATMIGIFLSNLFSPTPLGKALQGGENILKIEINKSYEAEAQQYKHALEQANQRIEAYREANGSNLLSFAIFFIALGSVIWISAIIYVFFFISKAKPPITEKDEKGENPVRRAHQKPPRKKRL